AAESRLLADQGHCGFGAEPRHRQRRHAPRHTAARDQQSMITAPSHRALLTVRAALTPTPCVPQVAKGPERHGFFVTRPEPFGACALEPATGGTWMDLKMLGRSAALALPLCLAAPAFAQDVAEGMPDDPHSLTIGVGGGYVPSYEGSDDYE